jgi:hypothetical protein
MSKEQPLSVTYRFTVDVTDYVDHEPDGRTGGAGA